MGARCKQMCREYGRKSHENTPFGVFLPVVRTKPKSIADIIQNIYKLNNKTMVVCKTNCGKQYDGCGRRQ